jgi:hypothetical protein
MDDSRYLPKNGSNRDTSTMILDIQYGPIDGAGADFVQWQRPEAEMVDRRVGRFNGSAARRRTTGRY